MLTMILIVGAVAIAVGCAAGMISYEIDPGPASWTGDIVTAVTVAGYVLCGGWFDD